MARIHFLLLKYSYLLGGQNVIFDHQIHFLKHKS